MSEENVELTLRAADAINRRDLDAYLELCDPEVELIPRILEVEGGGSYRGHERVRTWWGNLFDVFPDFNGENEEVRDLGDVTVARARMSGQGIGSDAPTEQLAWVVTESGGGRRGSWGRVCLERGRGPRCCRAVGVGDVAGERGGPSNAELTPSTAETSKRCCRISTPRSSGIRLF